MKPAVPAFENSWANRTRAESYAKLEFPNTYYLAFRDLPGIINRVSEIHIAPWMIFVLGKTT
jgi:hypothetical protein